MDKVALVAVPLAIIAIGRVVIIWIGAKNPEAQDFIIRFTRADRGNRIIPNVAVNFFRREK
jgi:hypothetical protein